MQVVQSVNNGLRRIPAWSLYVLGALPVVFLVVQLFAGQLGADPVKALEHKMGEIGLQLLVACLAITPLRKYLGLNLLKFRRAIGVLAFFYILGHLAVWLALDIQFLWGEIWTDILKRPYITVGMVGFLLLLPLAITSNNLSVRKIGGLNWRKLHKLTYLAVPLGAIHFVMLVKGWQIEPLIYLGVILALLATRFRPRRT